MNRGCSILMPTKISQYHTLDIQLFERSSFTDRMGSQVAHTGFAKLFSSTSRESCSFCSRPSVAGRS